MKKKIAHFFFEIEIFLGVSMKRRERMNKSSGLKENLQINFFSYRVTLFPLSITTVTF